MKELYKRELMNNEVDVEEALYRFFNNENLYFNFLAKFLEDKNIFDLRTSLSKGSTKEAFFYAHTLKGLTSNLALKGLHNRLNIVVEYLRVGNLAKARIAFSHFEENYHVLCKIIRNDIGDVQVN